MLKKRNEPTDNTGEVFDQQTDDSTKNHKKYIKRTILFLLGLFLGMIFHYLLKFR